MYASSIVALACALASPETTTTPAPVSGRSLARPETITEADALARLMLLRDNLELIRRDMGRYPAPKPLIHATRATVVDAYYAGINLRRRLSRLLFEQLRVDVEWRVLPKNDVRAFEVYGLMDGALAHGLRVKQALGIEHSVAERVQPETTSATDLFNAMTETGALVNVLLDKKTQARDAFLGATVVTHVVTQLHVALTNRLMPEEPPLVPNKMPDDVLREVRTCFGLVSRLAKTFEIEPLGFTIADPADGRRVSADDVLGLIVLMLAELNRIREKAGLERNVRQLATPERKFPSDVFQRTRLIVALLEDLLAAQDKRRSR